MKKERLVSVATPEPTKQTTRVPADRPWEQFYPASVGDVEQLEFPNLGDLVRRSSYKYSERMALQCALPNGMSASLTYREVDELSDSVAAYLTSVLKLDQGERVAIQMPNCLAYPIVQFGVWKAGCVTVNINPMYKARELQEQIADSGARLLVGFDMATAELELVAAQAGLEKVLVAEITDFFPRHLQLAARTLRRLKKQVPSSSLDLGKLSDAVAMGHRAKASLSRMDYTRSVPSDTLACLQYTGGTTGKPKGAELTHRSIMTNLQQAWSLWGDALRLKEQTTLTSLPIYHVFAMSSVLMTYGLGIQNILIPNPRPISNLRKVFEKERITFMLGVNTLFSQLLNEPWFRENPPRFMDIAIAGGTALQDSVAEEWKAVVGHEICQGYGITEASPVVAANPLDGKAERGTIGIPLPGTDIRLVDDEGNDVAPGEPGELWVRGPQVMRAYWQNKQATDETVRDGWLLTGDIATMDNDGFFRIVDRKKDMIIVSGFNVYPNEIEEVLVSHPKVHDAGVVGLVDTKTGEAVHAFVVVDGVTVEELEKFCAKRLVAYKQPARIRVVDELPKTNVGKVLRTELRLLADKL